MFFSQNLINNARRIQPFIKVWFLTRNKRGVQLNVRIHMHVSSQNNPPLNPSIPESASAWLWFTVILTCHINSLFHFCFINWQFEHVEITFEPSFYLVKTIVLQEQSSCISWLGSLMNCCQEKIFKKFRSWENITMKYVTFELYACRKHIVVGFVHVVQWRILTSSYTNNPSLYSHNMNIFVWYFELFTMSILTRLLMKHIFTIMTVLENVLY